VAEVVRGLTKGERMAEGLRLEDWIGKSVTVNVYITEEVNTRERVLEGAEVVSDDTTTTERKTVVGVQGFLEGVDPNGVIVLFDPRDVASRRGPLLSPDPENLPRHVFFSWPRISLIERIEYEAE
jgi:hypothetical protein